MRTGGTRGGGRLPIVSGGELRDEKNKNREGDGASNFDGSCCIGESNNQPKVGRIDGIFGLGDAQGGGDRGRRRHTVSAFGLRGK